MTTLVNAHPYTHFYLGQVDDGDVADIRAADPESATEAGGVVTIAAHATTCQDFAYAIGSFTSTRGGDAQAITNLASRAAQNDESAVPSWEAPCTMRVYVSNPEVASDSVKLTRDSTGKYILYAVHEQLGKLAAMVVINGMTEPFVESGELIVTFTLLNSSRYLPKWVA